MKKLTALFLTVVMLVAMVIACIPASAAEEARVDVNSILDDEGYNGEAAKDWMWAGKSNCYYYDYFMAAKDGKTAPGGDPGNEYSLRAGKKGGSGSAGLCDGSKTSGSFQHDTGSEGFTVGDKKYTHYFGYSYKEAVTADSFAFYSSKDVEKYDNITSVDVYVASVNATNDGPGEWKLVGGATTSTTYTDDAGTALLFEGNFTEAATFNYIFFAVNCDNFAPDHNRYRVYEFNLFAPVVPEDTTAATTEAPAEDTSVTDPGATGDSAFVFVAIAVVAVLGVAVVAKRRFN